VADQPWGAVDEYLCDLLLSPDPSLDAALEASRDGGLPAINVAPNQGKLLNLLVRSIGARSILEIGTLGGFSTIWLARGAGPDGRVVTLEYEPRHADVARTNLDRAGVGDRVQIIVGAALETLPTVTGDPFDLVFIDADKENYPEYLQWAIRLTRTGSVILLDNVIRDGKILEPESDDPRIQATRETLELMGRHPQLDTSVIQTVGAKHWDGFAFAVVR